MRLNFNMHLLEQMAEGVILLDRQGQVLRSNRAAEPWLKGFRALQVYLKRQIDEEVRGRVQFPLLLEALQPTRAGAQRRDWNAWLCKDGGKGYAIFIGTRKPASEDAGLGEHVEQRFIALIGDSVRAQLDALRALLLAPDAFAHGGGAIAGSAAVVAHLLGELSELSALMQRDEVFSDERLTLDTLLPQALAPLQPFLAARALRAEVQPVSGKMGVLYGDAGWMRYALRTLVEGLALGAPPGSRLGLGARQVGDFVMVTGRVLDDARATARSAAPTQPAAMEAGAGRAADDLANACQAWSNRLAISQRIFVLHGARAKLEWLGPEPTQAKPGALLESFVLTLATGLPEPERSRASCAQCPKIRQAQVLAEDIARLLETH